VLITGAGGNLGKAFARICEQRGLDYVLCTRRELDICSADAIQSVLGAVRPWAVVNAAGYVRVDEAERDDARCYRENCEGPARLAAGCAEKHIRFATFSSDLVFDGRSPSPYVETSPVAPLNIYGLSKVRAEREVLRENPDALVVRTSSFFGPWHPHDFLTVALRALSRRERFAAMHDVVVSPTYVPDLVDACIDLLIDAERGLWHLANRGSISWLELARSGAQLAGVDCRTLESRAYAEFHLPARRPAFSALATERGLSLPPLESALERYVREARPLWSSAA
jgi:dTDP-4-dehydrorhamnose reductase